MKSILLLNNVIPSPSKVLHSTVQICFSSKEFSSEKKQKEFHCSSKYLLWHFIIEHLEDFLSNVFFLMDQKQNLFTKKYSTNIFSNLWNNSRKNQCFQSNQINSTKFSILQNLIKSKYFHQIYQKKHFLTILFLQFSFEIIWQNQKIFFFSFTNLFKTFSFYLFSVTNLKILFQIFDQNTFSLQIINNIPSSIKTFHKNHIKTNFFFSFFQIKFSFSFFRTIIHS